jgi:hypothetical protein
VEGAEVGANETAPYFNDAEKEDTEDASSTSAYTDSGQSSLDEVDEPGFVCIHCWHRLKDNKGGISDDVMTTDEEFEDSPMLLSI